MNEVNILYGAGVCLAIAISIVALQNHVLNKRLWQLKNLVESMGMYLATKHMKEHQHTEECSHV